MLTKMLYQLPTQNANDANFVAILIGAVLILLAIALVAWAFRIRGNSHDEK